LKYYAAILSPEEAEACFIIPPYQVLGSFWYFRTQAELIRSWIDKGIDVFIDSGAFSAENSGRKIDIQDYCNFVRSSGAKLYAGLDVIGDAEQTMKNMRYMEAQELHPMPTFHMGGSIDDLRKMYAEYDYIALGGMVFKSGRERYCDEIWGTILREKPTLRVHGFGMTNVELMTRYPWYSVDSSTYKDGRRFGRPLCLWAGMEFKQFEEEEDFKAILRKMGHKIDENTTKKELRMIYDFYGVQAYKTYGEHLDVVNRTKDFSYLTKQHKMF